MKLHKLTCPACGASLDMTIDENATFVFCHYCGTKFYLDEEKNESTINKNINTNKNINVNKTLHKRYTDDAELLKIKYQDKEEKRTYIILAILFAVIFTFFAAIEIGSNIKEKNAIKEGKVTAGSYQDLIGEDFRTVEAHFEAAGFTNIELLEVKGHGIAFWENNKVVSISIGGDTSFDSSDYYYPDTKVVISYH